MSVLLFLTVSCQTMTITIEKYEEVKIKQNDPKLTEKLVKQIIIMNEYIEKLITKIINSKGQTINVIDLRE